jgi:hypothetical protein
MNVRLPRRTKAYRECARGNAPRVTIPPHARDFIYHFRAGK